MITASDIHYESGQHVQGLAGGGLGALLPLADTNERFARIGPTTRMARSLRNPI